MSTQLPVAPRRPVARRAGFSLVEMIGVLAIIAILAVVIVPKVFSTIASSRVTNAIASINSIKSAISEFSGKYGALPTTNANNRIDDLLMTAGLLEGRFVVKIGNQPVNPPIAGSTWARAAATGVWAPAGGSNQTAQSRIICLNSTAAAPNNGNNYLLDGTNPLPTASRVVSAVIMGVTAGEALDLSQRIDGDALSEPTTATADTRGKVIYTGVGATRNVYIYIAHQ